jgi:TPR repeat protein
LEQARPAIVPLCGVLLLLWLPFQEWNEPKSGLGPSATDTAASKALFYQGQRLWNTGNQAAATKPFFEAAQAGYAPAQLQIGWQYEKGIGVPQSYIEAARWYRAAAEQGQSTAMSNLGSLYELGEGVPEDWVTSARWRERSAKMGNMYGEASLGRAYQFGIGVPQSRELAIEWDQRATAHGNRDSGYFAQWLANPSNGIGFRSVTEKDLVTARFGSPDRVPASEPRGILFHNSTERMSWLLRQSASRPLFTERRKPAAPQRTDCCPCGPQMSDAQCFLKCNALIPRCP